MKKKTTEKIKKIKNGHTVLELDLGNIGLVGILTLLLKEK